MEEGEVSFLCQFFYERMWSHAEHVAVQPRAPEEFECYDGILSPSYGDEDTITVRSEQEFRRGLFCRDRKVDEVSEVDVIFVEEFAEAVLVDFIPEPSLFFRESARTDDNLLRTACFVVTDTADQVEREECAVEEAMWKVAYVDSTAWE